MKNPTINFSRTSYDINTDIPYMNVDVYDQLFSKWYNDLLYNQIISFFVDEKGEHIFSLNKRTKLTFGTKGSIYSIKYQTKTIDNIVIPWEKLPILQHVKHNLEKILLTGTKSKFNYCVVQLYPNSKVGIKPHRDKEMVDGSIIAGLSLGTTRTLTLTPPAFLPTDPNIDVKICHGSLYVFYPPTNNYWLHSIPSGLKQSEQPELDIRVSLTFRNL